MRIPVEKLLTNYCDLLTHMFSNMADVGLIRLLSTRRHTDVIIQSEDPVTLKSKPFLDSPMPVSGLESLSETTRSRLPTYTPGYDWVRGRFGPPPGIPRVRKEQLGMSSDLHHVGFSTRSQFL